MKLIPNHSADAPADEAWGLLLSRARHRCLLALRLHRACERFYQPMRDLLWMRWRFVMEMRR